MLASMLSKSSAPIPIVQQLRSLREFHLDFVKYDKVAMSG